MGCERPDDRLKPVDGSFVPLEADSTDILRAVLVEIGEPLDVRMISGERHAPDIVMVSGESVVRVLPEVHKQLGAGVTLLAFGSNEGRLELT